MWAAFNGHTATAAELLRLGADINAKDTVRIRCSCARGPRRRRVLWDPCEASSWARVSHYLALADVAHRGAARAAERNNCAHARGYQQQRRHGHRDHAWRRGPQCEGHCVYPPQLRARGSRDPLPLFCGLSVYLSMWVWLHA
jgi:hypothetical protein